jgi:hypothetical protein
MPASYRSWHLLSTRVALHPKTLARGALLVGGAVA